ncbi:MAG TPA: aldo/keto reductase [Solirubrobacteraceae bacterium]|jgi:aryl-alcohol dehydrogenase-like predicted oxidoreductase|nr:aldo/keto reductase [Solirubrobacteraceae bacterium]
MYTRPFGTTDLRASAIGFGTWALGSDWWGPHEDPDVLVARALELGITFFDTSDVYGQGLNEEIVGRALSRAGAPREEIQIATKFGYVTDRERTSHTESERPQDFSPAHTRQALEASLRRLGTDYVDLYQLHNPRMDAIERDDLFTELEALRDEGKIREYGVALGPKIGWRDEGVRALSERRLASLQTVYNLLEQEPGREFLELAEQRGAGIIARVPTSSGLLEGHLTPESTFEGNDHRRHRPRSWLTEGLAKVARLEFLERGGQRTLTQAAMQFILAQPAIACIVHTVTTVAELEEWVKTTEVPELDDDELARLSELYHSDFGLAATPS